MNCGGGGGADGIGCLSAKREHKFPSYPSLNLGEKLQLGIELTHNFGDLAAQKLSLCDSQWPKSCIYDLSLPCFLPSLLVTPAEASDWSNREERSNVQDLKPHKVNNQNQWKFQVTK